MKLPTLSPSEKVVVGGSVLAVIGVFLPWLTSGNVARAGFETDGFMALLFAVSIPGIVALWEWRTAQQIVVAGLGTIIAAVAGNYALTFGASLTGVGTYVVFIAGVLLAGGGVYGSLERRRETSETVEERARIE